MLLTYAWGAVPLQPELTCQRHSTRTDRRPAAASSTPCSSVVRSFRHAATLTAAQLLSSWITISSGLIAARETTQYQLDVEMKKKKKVGPGQQASTDHTGWGDYSRTVPCRGHGGECVWGGGGTKQPSMNVFEKFLM